MFSRSMYCHTSSSVQLEIGNTRKCSPGCRRVLNSVHSSGRWSLGCHWPKLSRCEKMRSLARAFSSSRRAPPISASKRNSSIASSSVTDWCTLRDSPGCARRTVPRFIESSTLRTISSAPSSLAREVAEVGHFGEVVAGVDHQQRIGDAARAEGLLGALEQHQRILAAREQQRRALEGGRDFAQDEDRFFLQRVEVAVAQLAQQLGFGAGVHAETSSLRIVVVFTCRPHSLAASSSHHQRPARKSSPRLMARVQGAQPMLG